MRVMKNHRLFLLSLISFLLITGGIASSQSMPPATATGHVLAEIVPIFTASETEQLNFGRFSPGPGGGEIILSPESTISVLGSIYKGPGSHNAASFYVTGDVDAAYTITLPSKTVLLTHISDARTMRVENWVSTPSTNLGSGKLQNGFQIVYVGATLKVGTLNDNPVGIYTGTYTITFDFN
jgi:hypothetical protein